MLRWSIFAGPVTYLYAPFIILKVAGTPKISELSSEIVLAVTFTMYTTPDCRDDIVSVVPNARMVIGSSLSSA